MVEMDPEDLEDALRRLIARHWGFYQLRPLQEQAMRAVLDRHDSLVVLPTGGGKSLCYQAPAFVRQREVTVVVSPLVALMKDQVDALKALDIPARCLNNTVPREERDTIVGELLRGKIRLLFVSPERLVTPGFQELLRRLEVRTFAIDEAHCISHWGHDFRPEYRQLRQLRAAFPDASVHAYTATATEQVRLDIIRQLQLHDPEVLVGDFDRPNLVYRVIPRQPARTGLVQQVRSVVERHRNEAGIIYCIRRRDVDELTLALQQSNLRVLPYHAGLDALERRATQEAFRTEKCDIVVATVAFGMGIDRSNVRFVLHTGMPKSIEHYQQEAGRAGRDGLEAECILLYSPQDFHTWRLVIEKSVQENGADPELLPQALAQLDGMLAYGRSPICRHRVLVEHFGQDYSQDNCAACDLCLGEVETEPESLVIAQKILSCIARVKESFGAGHVVSVLRGEANDRVTKFQHDQLSTYGLLRQQPAQQIRDWVDQLIFQRVLVRTDDDYPTLKLNAASWQVMRKQRPVRLLRTVQRKKSRESRAAEEDWAGVDRQLFDKLRALRRQLAQERDWPSYLVFDDKTLREICRSCPADLVAFHRIPGVGEAKLRDFGPAFLEVIQQHLSE